MKLPEWIRHRLASWAYDVTSSRNPDFVLEDKQRIYLFRWHIIPPNPVLSLYVHFFAGADFGRHLHDHRSGSLSLVLDGWYEEDYTTPRRARLQLLETYARREGGDIVYRPARMAHMVTRTAGCLTIFITGPSWRTWGFWVDGKWIPHAKYIAEQAAGPK